MRRAFSEVEDFLTISHEEAHSKYFLTCAIKVRIYKLHIFTMKCNTQHFYCFDLKEWNLDLIRGKVPSMEPEVEHTHGLLVKLQKL